MKQFFVLLSIAAIAFASCCNTPDQEYLLSNPGDHVQYTFTGTSVSLDIEGIAVNQEENSWLYVYVDDNEPLHIEVTPGENTISIAEGLSNGKHSLEVTKVTEYHPGVVKVKGLVLDKKGKYSVTSNEGKLHIHYIGDSTTCGYGVDADTQYDHFTPETENFCHTYCYIVAKELDAQWSVEAVSGIGLVNNGYGVPEGNPTMTEKYPFDNINPDYICANIGVNDLSNPAFNTEEWIEAYKKFISELHNHYPKAAIICMCGPMFPAEPGSGPTDDDKHCAMIQESLADLDIDNVHFLKLEGRRDFGFGADWHPSIVQHAFAAEQLKAFIETIR